MIKRFIQHFIVKTDIGPLAWIYRACYAMALKRIVHVLKKQPGIVAVYLVSGLAADSCVPGLSDIDLIIIVDNTPESKDKVSSCYTKLSRVIPLLIDSEQGIFRLEEIKEAYAQGNSGLIYKIFIECKKQGKLLFGRDVLGDFGELGTVKRNEFIIGQLTFTWMLFLNNFIVKNKTPDVLIRNYYCYKFTSYACGALISARLGQDLFNRRKILETALPLLDASRQAHVKAVISSRERRFSGQSPCLVEDTYDFCMNTIQDTIRHMPAIPASREDQEAYDPKNYDLASFDFLLSDVNKRAIDAFVELVKKEYSQYIASVLVSPLDLFLIKEQNIGVFIIPHKHLPFTILKKLSAAFEPSQSCPQRLCLYMVTCGMAISLNHSEPSPFNFTAFPLDLKSPMLLYLSMPSSTRFGAALSYQTGKKILTNYFWQNPRESILQERIAFEKLINDRHVLRSSSIEFQTLFWQALQLFLIETSFDEGKMFIPLSSKQVYRRCQQIEGLYLPWLEKFHDQYRKDLSGFPSDAEAYFPQALEFLKKIYAHASDTACKNG